MACLYGIQNKIKAVCPSSQLSSSRERWIAIDHPCWRTKQQNTKGSLRPWVSICRHLSGGSGSHVRFFVVIWGPTFFTRMNCRLLNCVHLLMYYYRVATQRTRAPEARSIFIEYIRSMCHSVPPLCHLPNSFQPHKIGELLEQNKLRSHDTKYCTTSSFHEFPQFISIPAEKYPSKYENLNFL